MKFRKICYSLSIGDIGVRSASHTLSLNEENKQTKKDQQKQTY